MVEFTTSTIEDIKNNKQGQGATCTSTPSAQTTTTKSSGSGMFTTSSPDDVGKGKLPYSQVKSKINQDRFDIPTDVLMDDTYGGGFNRDTASGTGTSSTEALKTFSENEDPTKVEDGTISGGAVTTETDDYWGLGHFRFSIKDALLKTQINN